MSTFISILFSVSQAKKIPEEPSDNRRKKRNFYIIKLPTLKRGMKSMGMASLDEVGNVPVIPRLAISRERDLEGTNMGISSIWVE